MTPWSVLILLLPRLLPLASVHALSFSHTVVGRGELCDARERRNAGDGGVGKLGWHSGGVVDRVPSERPRPTM